MSKLYYDCPLQAAYMNKEFGVEYGFQDGEGDFFYPEKLNDFLEYENGEKIKIHPDSLSIFEPQEGDKSDGYTFGGGVWESEFELTFRFETEPIRILRHSDSLKTEKRNGKPFFAPKEED